MKIIFGLGNPGLRYRSTRHNIGFIVIDRIASESKIRIKKRRYASLCGEGRLAGEEVLLAKPLTYMNLSGRAVKEAVRGLGAGPDDLLIVVDDADLPFGGIRLRPKGSSGGHKGLRSIIEELGTEDFARLRVGIGLDERRGELRDYVLAPFRRDERRRLEELTARCLLCVRAWIEEGIGPSMSRFNA